MYCDEVGGANVRLGFRAASQRPLRPRNAEADRRSSEREGIPRRPRARDTAPQARSARWLRHLTNRGAPDRMIARAAAVVSVWSASKTAARAWTRAVFSSTPAFRHTTPTTGEFMSALGDRKISANSARLR